MPISGQIVPEHWYPHTEVYINDNSELQDEGSSAVGGTRLFCTFISPKGEDNVIKTISYGSKEFLDTYGLGPAEIYGQPLINAYAAVSTGAATLHCLRIAADDATYANIGIYADYTTIPEGGSEPAPTEFAVNYHALSDPTLQDLGKLKDLNVTATGLHQLFTIAYKGRGVCGNDIHVRISTYARGDRSNSYKNYTFEIFEGSTKKETFNLSFSDDSIVNQESLFAETVINDPNTGSSRIKISVNIPEFVALYEAYKAFKPDSTLTFDDFDPILGINKYTNTAIEGFVINTDTSATDLVTLNNLAGVALKNGSDGAFAYTAGAVQTARLAAIEAKYQKVFKGEVDARIFSKNLFPIDILVDANYDIETKLLIAALASKRGDCMAFLDMGTKLASKQDPIDAAADFDIGVNDRLHSIDCYYGQIKDPYNFRVIDVSAGYALALKYPLHFQQYNGKYIPFAGGSYGHIDDVYLKGTIFPIYDEDLDSALMDELINNRLNYARVNPKGDIIRGTQTTRQDITTNLSEINNMLIVLDIKRDCEQLVSEYEYNFNDPTGIARFNRDAEALLYKYAEAQVTSITASFDSNAWERDRGILHLYVAIVNKPLIKINLVEIDVNR